MNKGFGINKKEEEQKSLVNDIEFTHKTKKAIILARQGKFLESEKEGGKKPDLLFTVGSGCANLGK